MKISDKKEMRIVQENNKNTAKKNIGSGLFSLFSAELNTKQVELLNNDSAKEQLRTDLENAGILLEQEPTILNFKNFRELLSKLAKQVSSEAYRLEKVGGTPTNPRYYEIITIIDKEADKLYELVVKEQKDRMAITASVIGIKGLVVDLLT